jgi:acetyl-CoA synthetase
MNRIANMLRAYGVKKGDRVAIYMPCCSMTVATMLACARIGAIHSVVFAGFSADALASRINDCKEIFNFFQIKPDKTRSLIEIISFLNKFYKRNAKL